MPLEPVQAQEVIAGGIPQVVVAPRAATTDLRIELFVRPDSEQCRKAQAFLADLEARRPGIRVDVYDVSNDANALARVKALSTRFGRTAALPTVVAANQMVVGFRDAATTGRQIESLFTMEVFIRDGCPRCAAATPYLAGIKQRYPGLDVVFFEVTRDPSAQARLNQLAQTYGVPAGYPAVHFGGRLNVGWSGVEISGSQIEGLLRSAAAPPRTLPPSAPTSDSPSPPPPAPTPAPASPPGCSSRRSLQAPNALVPVLIAMLQEPAPAPLSPPSAVPQEPRVVDRSAEAVPAPGIAAGAELPEEAMLPDEADPTAGTEVLRPTTQEVPQSLNVPFFGRLDPRQIGMPAFTFAVGLVDGFNPCAMWVLVFLLSVLAGLNDRRKMAVVAGTYVAVSALAYFLFMAAWLGAFQLVGFLKPEWVGPIQMLLGALAVVIGVVHVKDFFAFKKGVSLSIPDSAKSTIYDRVRRIVTAENLIPALVGATVLAVLVNAVELLCTAGFPAVYTRILASQNHPTWINGAYLFLYIVAYMLDDTIVLVTAVVTLSRRRLQEKEGRWLKLLSGAVILCLGLVMLIKPEWLEWMGGRTG
jgi:cytochrome c biogenesis protein CcdA